MKKTNDNREPETPIDSTDLVGAVPVQPDKWAHMVRCTAVVEWLQKQGVCWRGADIIDGSWRIGEETEWLYHDLIDEVEKHRNEMADVQWRLDNL